MSEYIYETQGEQVIGNPKGFILPKEEIVRCKDCAWFEPWDSGYPINVSIGACYYYQRKIVGADCFCSWAEKVHNHA